MQRMTVQKYRKIKQPRSKYGNKKVEVDGHVFDSKAEAKYYEHLKWLEAAKQILFFKIQPRYLLQEGFEKGGEKHRKIEYVADFEVHKPDGSIEVVDVKGAITQVFAIKRKLFEKKYPHKLVVLGYDENFGFLELDKLKKLKQKR